MRGTLRSIAVMLLGIAGLIVSISGEWDYVPWVFIIMVLAGFIAALGYSMNIETESNDELHDNTDTDSNTNR